MVARRVRVHEAVGSTPATRTIGESFQDSPMVRVAGVEPTASWTRNMRATNCATPGCSDNYYTEFFRECQGHIEGKPFIDCKRA